MWIAIVVAMMLLGAVGQSWGGVHKHGKPKEPIQGPIGPRGEAGSDASTGLMVNFGLGVRHQEKWFDLDAIAYKDVRHGGVTTLGLIMVKPFKSHQDRQIEAMKEQIAALIGEVHSAKKDAKKALGISQDGADAAVKTIEIRNEGSR